MRITGGRYCGRYLKCPKGIIRPATGRLREALFSILGDLSNRSYLDLFAGSGSLGLEAISRGASLVHCVEGDPRKKETLLENLSLAEGEILCCIMTAEEYLRRTTLSFDLISLDPPFSLKRKEKYLHLIMRHKRMTKDGMIVLHHPKGEECSLQGCGLVCCDRRLYGSSQLSFYRFLQGE